MNSCHFGNTIIRKHENHHPHPQLFHLPRKLLPLHRGERGRLQQPGPYQFAQTASDTAAEFSAYVVKLVQKIDLLEEGAEFALTVEEV